MTKPEIYERLKKNDFLWNNLMDQLLQCRSHWIFKWCYSAEEVEMMRQLHFLNLVRSELLKRQQLLKSL